MQLLRDNLTLWTSSDGGEPEASEAKEDKPVEGEAAAPAEEKSEEAAAPAES